MNKIQRALLRRPVIQLVCCCERATVAGTDPILDSKDVKPFSEIPGPKGLPYIGTLLQYLRGPFSVEKYHDALLSRYRQYGPIFKETIAGHTIVHLMDPEYIKVMYQTEGKIPYITPLLKTTQMYRKIRNLSPGLGNTNGEEWYRLRSAVQQMMMRPKAVSMYLPLVNDVIDDFILRIYRHRDASNEVPNFRNEVLKWNLESSGMTCFETRLGTLDAESDSVPQKMIDANQNIFSLSLKLRFALVPWYKFIPSPTWRKLLQAEDYFFSKGQEIVDKTILTIKELVEAGELQEGQYGFLTYLMSKPELSYKDLSIITLSLFGDGLGTTVPTLIGQLYCLASHPDKQNKLYKEISDLVPKDSQITADIIGNMPYLKACVKEGFRFFPIGTEVSRLPQRDLVLAGYQIPAQTHVQLNNNMLLRSPEYFDNPEDYQPERWMRGEEKETSVHPYLLTPFGHGPRMCAGRRFAEQEMYVMIIKLLQKFELEWHHEPMSQEYRMLLVPDKPAQFTFKDRHS